MLVPGGDVGSAEPIVDTSENINNNLPDVNDVGGIVGYLTSNGFSGNTGDLIRAVQEYQQGHSMQPGANSKIQGDVISDLAESMNMNLSQESRDFLTQYYLSERSAQSAYERELYADSTRYQRMIEDLKKAGLNPAMALSGLSAGSVSSSGNSYSGSPFTNAKINAKANATDTNRTIMTVIASLIAVVGAALVKSFV